MVVLIFLIIMGFYILLFALARAARDPEELRQEEERRAISRALLRVETQADEPPQRKSQVG